MLPEITGKTAMLAKAGEPDSYTEYVMEPKYDGHRILIKVGGGETGGQTRAYARSGVDKTHLLPNIVREAEEYFPAGTVIDGEVVHWTETGGDWSKVQQVLGSNDRAGLALTFVAFDLIALLFEDVRLHPQHIRRVLLEKIFEGASEYYNHSGELLEHLRLTEQHPWDPDVAEQLMNAGWEGAILKPVNGVYRAGRHTGGWLKVKAMETEDVVIMGATPGKGRFTGQIGALVFGQYLQRAGFKTAAATGGEVEYTLVEMGQCSGMTDAQRAEFTMLHETGQLEGMVIEVRHFGKHESGGWKSPQFKRVRTDKAATECVA